MHWLYEGSSTAYLLVGVTGVACAAAWHRTRRREWLAAAGVCAAIVVALFLLDRFIESDREQIRAAVEAMATAAGKSDLGPIFRHISPSFKLGTTDRDGFRRFCEAVHKARHIRGMVVWDFEFGEVSRAARRGDVAFRFKVRGDWGGDAEFFLCRAKFVREGDGQWRMQSFGVFNPIVDSTTPMSIPGLGR